jgi:hypothetical protein
MDLAIERESGNFLVAKMRTIQSMSTEFNANNKRLGHNMMRNGELSQVIPEEHDGSRKGKQATNKS